MASIIDNFINPLGKDGGPKTGGLDMNKWYEMAAFDILGDMAFGQSFGSVDNGLFDSSLSFVLCGCSME